MSSSTRRPRLGWRALLALGVVVNVAAQLLGIFVLPRHRLLLVVAGALVQVASIAAGAVIERRRRQNRAVLNGG